MTGFGLLLRSVIEIAVATKDMGAKGKVLSVRKRSQARRRGEQEKRWQHQLTSVLRSS